MWVLWTLLAVGILFLCYMWLLAKGNDVLRHLLHLSGESEQIRFFFISDSHARPISRKLILKVKERIDFVLIGGDFADQRTPLVQIEANLKKLKQLGPIFFVWGNNDREVGEQTLLELFHRYGVTVLNNDAIQLPFANNVWLSAIDDTSSKYNIPKALEKCPTDANIIFVSHNPKIFKRVLPHVTPVLMLGGHLHGGQIRVGKYGMQPHGYYRKENGVQTLVSNGYGTTLVPLRLGAKPQTHVVTVKFSKQ